MNAAPFSAARFFQLGFVCADLDLAMAKFGDAPAAFRVVDVAALGAAPGNPVRRIALGYLGDTNFELIEIWPEQDSIYRPALPADGGPGFHHSGYLVDVLEPGDAAMAGDIAGFLSYVYIDRRSDLGHFVEYVKLGEGGRALFANLPRARLSLLAADRQPGP